MVTKVTSVFPAMAPAGNVQTNTITSNAAEIDFFIILTFLHTWFFFCRSR